MTGKEMRPIPEGDIGAHNPSGTILADVVQGLFAAMKSGTVEQLLADSRRNRGVR